MSRNGLLLITIVALQMQGLAQHLDSVQAMLALKDGKTTYRLGEGIVLDLSFTANELGYLVDTTTEPASPIDKITISPVDVCSRGWRIFHKDTGILRTTRPLGNFRQAHHCTSCCR